MKLILKYFFVKENTRKEKAFIYSEDGLEEDLSRLACYYESRWGKKLSVLHRFASFKIVFD